MSSEDPLKALLESIDKNPVYPHDRRSEPLFLDALEQGLIAYRPCGCTLPTVHVTKPGRAYLKDSSSL